MTRYTCLNCMAEHLPHHHPLCPRAAEPPAYMRAGSERRAPPRPPPTNVVPGVATPWRTLADLRIQIAVALVTMLILALSQIFALHSLADRISRLDRAR